MGKGLLSWIEPIRSVKEADLVQKIGLDATIFLRFLRMNRNIFICLTLVGVGVLLPINVIGANRQSYASNLSTYSKMTPQYISGSKFWIYVIAAYVFNLIVCTFLWFNYRAVVRLRRAYFASADYLSSLHSRTLMVFESNLFVRDMTDQLRSHIFAQHPEQTKAYSRLWRKQSL